MAANALGAQQKAVEELFFQNDAVSLRLLVNRRSRVMRVIDFRAGATEAKRLFVLSLARREGIEKICTLVERDEVATWVKLGFAKEGNIPGFYKRSDAFLLGCPVGLRPNAMFDVDSETDETPTQSETRLTVARPDLPGSGLTEAQSRMERTILAAKKDLKKGSTKGTGAAKVTLVPEGGARKAVAFPRCAPAGPLRRSSLSAGTSNGAIIWRRCAVASSCICRPNRKRALATLTLSSSRVRTRRPRRPARSPP